MKIEKILFHKSAKVYHCREATPRRDPLGSGCPENFKNPERFDSGHYDLKRNFRFNDLLSVKGVLTLLLMGGMILLGMILTEPGLSAAQTKKKAVVSQDIRKDPFSLPYGVRLLSTERPAPEEKKIAVVALPEAKKEDPPLKLRAILISDHIRLASIDRSIVTVGDTVNGEKVVEIKQDRVILEKGGQTRAILLDQGPVKLTVESR